MKQLPTHVLSLLIFVSATLTIILSCSKVNRNDQVIIMTGYFPFAIGNSWTYDMTVVTDYDGEDYYDGDLYLGEPFRDVDGDWVFNPFEPFTDQNNNQTWDAGEPYQDLNGNGVYDTQLDEFVSCECPDNQDFNHNGVYDGWDDPIPPDMVWIPGVTFVDMNKDGDFDYPNGKYDLGEPYSDLNGNGVYDPVLKAQARMELEVDTSTIINGTEVYFRRFTYYIDFDLGRVPIYQYLFSNDPEGLRWWGYKEWSGDRDYLREIEPIVLANPEVSLGEVIKNPRTITLNDSTFLTSEWTSVFSGLEEISTPAGRFRDCLKFIYLISGWPKELSQFNGRVTQWYAKGVGLVRQEGPGPDDFWELQSAIVGGKTYP